MAFTMPEDVVAGTMDLVITFSGFPVVNDRLNLCEELAKNAIECPLQSGYHNYTWTNVVPAGLPHGTLDTRETWRDASGGEILCMDYRIDI